ncbi:cellulase family glycosylhydrolase [Streptomyces sp. NPDC005426]|uniref:cellulase family glycosylhydrolase n=1 Tax=Streptomyces sp. NPDC005426 TaxID=3155344 RepID=UPI0033AA20A9
MRRILATAAGALLAVTAAVLTAPHAAQAAAASPGFHVSDGRLLDANGDDFVLRGVNHAHAWYTARTPQALKDIKALGANSARVVLSTGDQWTRNDAADVAAIVEQCKASRLVCVLEAHDTTGYGEAGAAVPLSRAVDYWKGIKSAVEGQEKYVILNLGNEPYGNTGYADWTSGTTEAIKSMRSAGFKHTIMVDAPNWGQDWSFTMRDNAAGVFAADPDKNTVFSIHMYGVYDTAAEVQDYLNRFVSQKLPIVVGEFGDAHSDGNPDEDAIMATAQQLKLGYLGWSWSGNGGGVEYLDLATGFDAGRLTAWGQRLFNGANGIKATAHEAGVYGSGNPGGDGDGEGQTGTCQVTYRLSDWGSTFNADVTIRNTGTTAVKGWKLQFSFPGDQRVNSAWNAKVSQQGKTVTATHESWTETIGAGGSVSFGLSGSSASANGAPSTFVLNGASCTKA